MKLLIVTSAHAQQTETIAATPMGSDIILLESNQPGAIPEDMMTFQEFTWATDVTQGLVEPMTVLRTLSVGKCLIGSLVSWITLAVEIAHFYSVVQKTACSDFLFVVEMNRNVSL